MSEKAQSLTNDDKLKSLTINDVENLLNDSKWQNNEYKYTLEFRNNNVFSNKIETPFKYEICNDRDDGKFYIKSHELINYEITIISIDEYDLEINYPTKASEPLKFFRVHSAQK